VTAVSRLVPAELRPKMDPAVAGSRLGMLQAAIFVFVLGGILWAGLWPFHSPKNDVKWLAPGNGLSFGDHGTILSSGSFEGTNAGDHAPCSLEIWLEPELPWDSSTILVFYARGRQRQFSLRQSLTNVELRTGRAPGEPRVPTARLYVNNILRQGKQLFLTITSNGSEERVYIDGALTTVSSKLSLSAEDFSGELIIANSPVQNDSWEGQLFGLASYRQELSPSQVLDHYQTWTKAGRPAITADEQNSALYLFDEHEGHTVHNVVKSGIDLYLPERYMVFDEKFLERPWDEYSPNWSYLKNVLINIGGFIPLGFCATAYFSSVRKIRRAVLFTVLLGCAATLTIEILQAYLPTRDSGMTDLITNTLGTCLGVALYHWWPARTLYFAVLNRILLVTLP
jgi:VanZ family protein